MQTRFVQFLRNPPRPVEIAIWLALITAIVGIRVYLVHLLPVILWSHDADSYTESVFHWMHSGVWETSPRRGPVYSLLIAGCLKAWGNFDALMIAQHVMGGLAVLAAIIVLCVMHGRRAMIPIGFCGYAYAVYALPIYLEHLVRNETLLFFFATLIFVSWHLAVARKQPHWLWVTGVAAGLMQLTKGVFGPLPAVLIALHVYFDRREPKVAAKHVAIFVVAFALPILGEKIQHRLTRHHRPPAPQAGILLFGRTAQFTALDSPKNADAKAVIRQDILDYVDYVQKQGLEPNIILKKTAVPDLQRWLSQQGKTPVDLNKLCLSLAIEAIQTHKHAYAKQAVRDLSALFKCAGAGQSPTANHLNSTKTFLETKENIDSLMEKERTLGVVNERIEITDAKKAVFNATFRSSFARYRHRVNEAWLFRFFPVLLTSLLLPFLVYFTNDRQRLWWLGCAAMWYFTLVLLSIIGQPFDRYLLPAAPIMFWTLASAVVFVWRRFILQNRITLKYSTSHGRLTAFRQHSDSRLQRRRRARRNRRRDLEVAPALQRHRTRSHQRRFA